MSKQEFYYNASNNSILQVQREIYQKWAIEQGNKFSKFKGSESLVYTSNSNEKVAFNQ